MRPSPRSLRCGQRDALHKWAGMSEANGDRSDLQCFFDGFSVNVEVTGPNFAQAPTEFQRNWLLKRAMLEFGDDLEHLSVTMPGLVPGVERPAILESWEPASASYDTVELLIQGQQVMQTWEEPLMYALAQSVARTHGDVLEVGFGMGMSAQMIQALDVRSHTIIECNEQVIRQLERWKAGFPGRDIRVIRGLWQDAATELDLYDGVLFDTYPVSQPEYTRNEVNGTAYSHAGEFFRTAAKVLRPGGVFTYFTCETDTISRGHQRLLLEHFDRFCVSVVRDLEPPVGCQYWWAKSMAVVEAQKGS